MGDRINGAAQEYAAARGKALRDDDAATLHYITGMAKLADELPHSVLAVWPTPALMVAQYESAPPEVRLRMMERALDNAKAALLCHWAHRGEEP